MAVKDSQMKGRIMLGPAGSPEPSTIGGVASVSQMGLSALEVEFTHGVRMKKETAEDIGRAAKKFGIALSVHAPYFINMASEDPKKREASKQRILQSAELASIMGATPVVFHAAYYGKMPKEECYEIVRDAIIEIQETMRKNGWHTELAPETTGKCSQFGTVEELLRLRKETGCGLCIDFAHILARNGKIDYDEVLGQIRGLPHVHSHFSGIEYTEKGERRHKIMEASEIKKLIRAVVKAGADITIISESPITWQDSLKMKKIVESLRVRERD
jgi:deoxyribonuclease-4